MKNIKKKGSFTITFKNIIILFIAFCLTINNSSFSVLANLSGDAISESIYMDGIEYTMTIDEDGNTKISAVFDGILTILEVDSETGEAILLDYKDKHVEEVTVQIDELNDDAVDVFISDDSTGEEIQINSIDDLMDESYVGQEALTLGAWALTAAVAALLAALAKIALTIVVVGVTFYALHKTTEKVKNGNYYRAHVPPANSKLETIYVNFTSLTKTQAINRIKKGQSTYTFFKSHAKSIVVGAGYGVTSAENHANTGKKKGVYFSHFHTSNRNGAHSFYGTPTIKK